MRDFFDQALAVGDFVAFISHSRTSSELKAGFIVGFTKCFIRVHAGTTYSGQPAYVNVSPFKVIKK